MKKLICLLIFGVAACASYDPAKYGKLSRYNTNDKDSFIFSVNEEFVALNEDSPNDKKHPKMTIAEVKLLKKLLTLNNYCIKNGDNLVFEVTSKQEKIYDITFLHLIEQNYKAKPAAPKMYFGRCL